MNASIWTPERRQKQAEAIRARRPWELSTGPRTKAGKKKVSRNGFKGAVRPKMRRIEKTFRNMMRQQKALLELVEAARLTSLTDLMSVIGEEEVNET